MNLSEIKVKIVSLFGNIKIIHIVIIIGLALLIQAIWAYQSVFTSDSAPENSQVRSISNQNKISNVISLVTSKSGFKVGEKIPVNINIESTQKTAGVDLILKYDPNLLSVEVINSQAPVTVGSIYEEYPVNNVDEKLGLITVSGITNKTSGVIPQGIFGTIVFKAKAAGNAKIFLEFTKGSTNDTNMIENQTASDILEEVKNLDLKITP